MTLDSIDLILWLVGIGLEVLILGLVIRKRVYRTLPVFSSFFLWCLLSDAGLAIAVRFPNAYLQASMVNITIDALFQLTILAELGRAVVRYNRVTPPSKAVIVLLAVLALGLSAFLNRWALPSGLPFADTLYIALTQMFAVLRVVFLLTLVWWSSLQGLKWPARELRIVTGLGVYIVATLSIALLHIHNLGGMHYHWLDQLLVGIYVWTLAYWVLAATTSVVEVP